MVRRVLQFACRWFAKRYIKGFGFRFGMGNYNQLNGVGGMLSQVLELCPDFCPRGERFESESNCYLAGMSSNPGMKSRLQTTLGLLLSARFLGCFVNVFNVGGVHDLLELLSVRSSSYERGSQ